MTESINTYRKDLQGLRAVSILLIVLAHSSLGIFEGGFVGVDVFFVLSGFLITGILQKELYQTNGISFINFYGRRLKRLLPALLFMILIVFLSSLFLLSDIELNAQLESTNFALTWISNIYFSYRDIDYFNELLTQDMFLHTWSLGVEEQFYIIWPIIMIIIFKINLKTKINYVYILVIILILSFITSILWMFIDPVSSFYMMPSRIWQFTLGALVYFYIQTQHFQLVILSLIGLS